LQSENIFLRKICIVAKKRDPQFQQKKIEKRPKDSLAVQQ